MKNRLFFTFVLLSLAIRLFSQYDLPFGFEKRFDIPAYDSVGNALQFPWTGGLYAVQFGEIDLDDDGIRDLVIFDRYGNRTLTWKNQGIPNQIGYQFAPELGAKLPRFDDWVIFADYDMDGLNDIFTYSKGFAGIKVYRNNGPAAKEQFELVVSPYLTSFQGNGYVNILVTYVDYPAIVDIDGDGDLDILTFWGLGSFVEMHTNESMELYGVPDSLIFRKTDNCWGQFAESEESNLLYLDTCFTFPKASEDKFELLNTNKLPLNSTDEYRHTGSTFLLFDQTGNGVFDLLLGDVDYAAPALLINSGTNRDAYMESFTFTFPAYDTPIDLLSFPVMSMIDLNNSGRKDLIVSVFDPSLVKSKNIDNVWFYENVSEMDVPDFRLRTKSFLQDEMFDFGAGTTPVFFDYNGNGLEDLLVGNFGYLDSCYYGLGLNLNCYYRGQLALLENVGSNTDPAYQLVDKNFADLPGYFEKGSRPYAIAPALADLDGDGDMDLLIGSAWGNLLFFENVAPVGAPADFMLADENYQNISVGSFSAPQLFDLTGNGLHDLIIGKRNGTISFYENTGNASNPVFTHLTDSLGGVDVRNPNLSIYGYAIPHFFKDNLGTIHLFVGSEFGEIYYYQHIEGNLDEDFELVMKNYLWIDEGLRSAVAVGNLNQDNYPDMIIGNYSGGLLFFMGAEAPPAGTFETEQSQVDIQVYPNPANDYLQIVLKPSSSIFFEKISIFDFSGKRILTLKPMDKNSHLLDISNLPDGIYILNIELKQPNHYISNHGFKILKQ
jgi:hypothetical protein